MFELKWDMCFQILFIWFDSVLRKMFQVKRFLRVSIPQLNLFTQHYKPWWLLWYLENWRNSIILWYTLAALIGANFWEYVLVTLPKHIGTMQTNARWIDIGLFCCASLSAKRSFNWQEVVNQSHRNIPYSRHCEGTSPQRSSSLDWRLLRLLPCAMI